jgi:hypothetical protein
LTRCSNINPSIPGPDIVGHLTGQYPFPSSQDDGSSVQVGGTCEAVGGTSVAVGGTSVVAGIGVAISGTAVAQPVKRASSGHLINRFHRVNLFSSFPTR